MSKKFEPGNLVTITDDKKSNCFRVLSNSLLEKRSNPFVPLKLEPDPIYFQSKLYKALKLPVSERMRNDSEYDECSVIWAWSKDGRESEFLGRTPELPTWGMFLERVYVKSDNKCRHMACVLGPDRKYIVPLHFLSHYGPQANGK